MKKGISETIRPYHPFRVRSRNPSFSNVSKNTTPRKNFLVRPHRGTEESGIDASIELIRTMHSLPSSQSFEIWNRENTNFVFSVEQDVADRFQELFLGWFPQTEVEEEDSPCPEVRPGDHISVGELYPRNNRLLQLRNPLGADMMKHDPFEDIIELFEQYPEEARTIIQVAYEPAPDDWHEQAKHPVAFSLASRLGLKKYWPSRYVESSEQVARRVSEKGAGERVTFRLRNQKNEPAFVANIRLAVISQKRETARGLARELGSVFEMGYTDGQMKQGLNFGTVPNSKTKDTMGEIVNRNVEASRLKLGKPRRRACLLTVPELASLAHLPSTAERDIFSFFCSSIEYS